MHLWHFVSSIHTQHVLDDVATHSERVRFYDGKEMVNFY